MSLAHPQFFSPFCILTALLLLLPLVTPPEVQVDPSEYQIKAERICSFARFVQWPSTRFLDSNAPFVIGVYGTDSISIFLREALQNRQIQERPVVIKHILSPQELSTCHVLFISRSERERLSSILSEVHGEGVLTVGESDNFLARGGIINLINIGGNIRFQVSLDAVRRERLVFSSKLLQLAVPENADHTTESHSPIRSRNE